MASKRKHYHTILQVELLSPEPIPPGELDELSDLIRDGFPDASVIVDTDKENRQVGRRKTHKILKRHGHEEEFDT